jgi:hypothetical protein
MDSTESKSYLAPLILALILVLGGTLYYYLRITYPSLFKDISSQLTAMQKSFTPTPTPTPEATPSPTSTPTPIPYVLPKGAQTYTFSHGSEVKGPKIQSVTISPLDPKEGATQTITLTLESDTPVTSTLLTITTDNQETELQLERKDGDELKGTYATSWKISDTYASKYSFHYVLKNQNDTFDSMMDIR